jgi:hypothetical protein
MCIPSYHIVLYYVHCARVNYHIISYILILSFVCILIYIDLSCIVITSDPIHLSKSQHLGAVSSVVVALSDRVVDSVGLQQCHRAVVDYNIFLLSYFSYLNYLLILIGQFVDRLGTVLVSTTSSLNRNHPSSR